MSGGQIGFLAWLYVLCAIFFARHMDNPEDSAGQRVAWWISCLFLWWLYGLLLLGMRTALRVALRRRGDQ